MINVTITEEWYNELKGLIKMDNLYFYQQEFFKAVEVDVNEAEFEKVSKKLGWM